MNTHTSTCLRSPLTFIGFAFFLTATTAIAQVASGTTGIDASGSYNREIQACQNGQSQQDQATCLREARNAKAEKELGTSSGSSDFKGNATARCDVLNGEDKAACLARVMGYGSNSGSVAGGGVLTQVETVVLPSGSSPVLLVPSPAR